MRVLPGIWVRKFGSLLLAAIVTVFSLGLLYMLGDTLFAIRNIRIVGEGFQVTVDEERIVKNLLFFPTDALRAQLLRDYPILEDMTITKDFPDTLVIALQPREAVVQIDTGGRVYLVTDRGFVLGDASGGESLPIGYFGIAAYTPGDQISEKDALAFVRFVSVLPSGVRALAGRPHTSSSVRIDLTDVNIYITHDADFAAKASTLQTLLGGFRIKGTLPTVIDLRFDKPIVTF